MTRLIPSLIFVMSLVIGPLMIVLSAPAPRSDVPLLVVVPPWRDAERLISRAGGRVIGPIRAPFAVMAAGDTPQFAANMRDNGAWALLDAGAIAEICGWDWRNA